MAEMQSDEDFRNVKVGGNLDRYGMPRVNKGGRPKDPRSGWSANLSRKQRLQVEGPKKAKRLEVPGQVQKEMCEKLDELEQIFPTLTERPTFWQAAKSIIGDMNRERCNKCERGTKRSPKTWKSQRQATLER